MKSKEKIEVLKLEKETLLANAFSFGVNIPREDFAKLMEEAEEKAKLIDKEIQSLMEEIHIIYEVDCEIYPIGFVDNEEEAEIFVHEQNVIEKRAYDISRKIEEDMFQSEEWKPPLTPKIIYPKWKAGISESEITDEMRSEREAIRNQNKEIHLKNLQIAKEVRERKYKERIRIVEEIKPSELEYKDYNHLNEKIVDLLKKEIKEKEYVSSPRNLSFMKIERLK